VTGWLSAIATNERTFRKRSDLPEADFNYPWIHAELRVLIRRMSIENPLWGAPRIHGELLKLGFEVAKSSVAK
jgi:hypothetical protein